MKTNIPVYNDGEFRLYELIENDEVFSKETLHDTGFNIWFEELSVFDKLKYELSTAGIELSMKLRIPQYKKINSMCVVKIDGEYHRVYNAAHFRNKDGFLQTDLTLYPYQPQFGEEKNDE